MTKHFICQIAICFLFQNSHAQTALPADKKATPETVHLYNNLKKLQGKGFMFGHQDDLAYGVNWKYIPGNSDIKEVTGDYPAVYGWELGHLELDSIVNLDGVPFQQMKHFIQEGYERGGVITISWHFTNALTGKSAWDAVPGTVAAILPGAAKHDLYKSWLEKLARFIADLKSKKGVLIPVIFRPFHELNGSWFWWGKNLCTPDELKQLYQFTESYLRDTKNIHNLLYAFNTDRFSSREEYLERFPGNEWVDIIGFDIYQRGKDNEKFAQELDKSLSTLEAIAAEKNKIPALTEFGYGQVPDSTWWTSALLKGIGAHKIAYALAWRNAGKSADGRYEYYVPYKGQVSANNFTEFYKDKRTLFQKDVTKEKLYD
jgi:Glycosyl hydrolase family 26